MDEIYLDFCETKSNSFVGGNYIASKEISSLDFLIQIDLKNIKNDFLPNKGILYFFYDLNNNINFDNKNKQRCKVYYENKLLKSKKGQNKLNKKYLKIINKESNFQLLGKPKSNNYHNYNLELISRNYNLIKGDKPLPYLLEDIKSHEKDWILLLQINSNEVIKIADNGSLYFYIKKEDLIKLNFDNVYCIKESY